MGASDKDRTKREIEEYIGRSPILEKVVHKGMKGFVPIYFDFNEPRFVSKTFADSEKECLLKFKLYLEDKYEREDARNSDQD